MNTQKHFRSLHAVALALALLIVVHDASSAPTDDLPAVDLPARYTSGVSAPVDAVQRDWWNAFGDPELNVLVQKALADNLDVAAATARVVAARAQRGIADSRFAPQLSTDTSVTRQGFSDNGVQGAALPQVATEYRTGLNASWEIDLFGMRAATRRQSAAQLDASIADRDAARLLVSAEVTSVYLEHALFAQKLESARRELAAGEHALSLVVQQYAAGAVAEEAVRRASKDAESLRSAIPRWTAEVETRKHAMGTLLGTAGPVELSTNTPALGAALDPVQMHADPNVGLPSDLLRRRPDIKRAEAELHSALAARDVAIADQYPRFSLIGGLGRESLRSGSLLEAASRVWSLGPQLTLPLLDGSKRKSTVAMRRAEVDAASARYRSAVMTALADAEQAIIRYQAATSSMTSTLASLSEVQRILDIEERRHAHGDTSLVEVLDARRQFEQSVTRSLEAKQDVLASFVSLHKSLGGSLQ
jgi:NodT family efflux transporter outer membrane factor (OMF) lipoprotein